MVIQVFWSNTAAWDFMHFLIEKTEELKVNPEKKKEKLVSHRLNRTYLRDHGAL
jgi:hypothetical protein